MLFQSSIRKELARSFGATLVVLVTIVMTILLIRTLGQAARGSFNPADVLMVMGYTVLGHLPTILTLSLFIAIVGTLSRMYRDSEMAIWFASGRSLAGFVPPLFRFAWPVLLVISVLALLVWPWANQQTQDLRDRYEKRGDLERVAPGQFQESAAGKRVFFIDKDSEDGRIGKNVFISASENGKDAVTSARSGRLESVGQDRFLVLSNGQRLETGLANPDLKISDFEIYGSRLGDSALAAPDSQPAATRPTLDLIQDPNRINLGELAWRLGRPLAAINLVLIAVAVSSINPRAGRSGSLAFALFTFIFYYNLLNLGNSWIATGLTRFAPFLLAVHGGGLLLALTWLGLRNAGWRLRQLWRPARMEAAGQS
jgi:lipopolysaccharide export system permease protein